MKITVLDGYTLNPGDLDWCLLSRLGELTVYDRTPPTLTAERIGTSEIVLTNKTVIDRAVLDQCPSVRYIGVLATGYNVVDTVYAAQRGIIVTNVPAYSTQTVAQHAFALLLELTNHVAKHAESVSNGGWTNCPDFSYQLAPLTELDGKTMGLVGYGRIGQAVAKIASSFGMRVLAYTRTPRSDAYATYCSFERLLAESDIISLHCPLTAENKELFDETAFAAMKTGALLINTARGGLVNESALCEALYTGKLAGAAVDVVSCEPISKDNPLLYAKNLLITPHHAWAAKEARERLMKTAAENIAQFLDGTPVNVVNMF